MSEKAWLYARDLADELDVTHQHANRLIRSIPGAALLYAYEGRKGERWRVSRADFVAWLASRTR